MERWNAWSRPGRTNRTEQNAILMTDAKNPGETLSVAPAKTLTLRRPVEAGIVRQSFSHGRSKAVVVEKVKRRTVAPGETHHVPREAPAAPSPAGVVPRPAQQRPSGSAQAQPRAPSGVILRSLTEEEQEARSRALSEAREREAEERKRAEAEAQAREEREARKREEDARRAQEAETKRRAELEAKRRLAGEPPAPAAAAARKPAAIAIPPTAVPRPSLGDEEELPHPSRRPGLPAKTASPRPPRGAEPKSRGRLTVASVTGEEDEERTRSVASFRRRVQRLKGHISEAKEKLSREVVLPETITIQELASRMSERAVDVIKLLMKQGQMAKITDVID